MAHMPATIQVIMAHLSVSGRKSVSQFHSATKLPVAHLSKYLLGLHKHLGPRRLQVTLFDSLRSRGTSLSAQEHNFLTPLEAATHLILSSSKMVQRALFTKDGRYSLGCLYSFSLSWT